MLLKNYRRFKFLSTPSARRATQKHMQMGVKRVISIHALREEGDLNPPTQEKRPTNFYPRPPRGGRRAHARNNVPNLYISIHALREEGDPNGLVAFATGYTFLSTPSARRATLQCLVTWSSHRYFYPRPPRGGRRCRVIWVQSLLEFLSTPSARRATR